DSKQLIVWEKRKAGWALELWDVAGPAKRTLLTDQPITGSVFFTPNGKTFAFAPDDELIVSTRWQIRDASDGKLIMIIRAVGTWPSFSNDNRTVWMRRGHVFVPFDMTTGKHRANGPEPPGPVGRFRFAGEDKLIGWCEDL